MKTLDLKIKAVQTKHKEIAFLNDCEILDCICRLEVIAEKLGVIQVFEKEALGRGLVGVVDFSDFTD